MTDIEAVREAIMSRCFTDMEGSDYAHVAQAAITAYRQWLSDNGMVIVPREPTKEMCVAGDDCLSNCMDSDYSSNADGDRFEYSFLSSGSAARTWSAMIKSLTPASVTKG